MILLFEPQCVGVQHAEVNAALIEVLMKLYPDQNFHFYSEIEHGLHVKSLISPESKNNVSFFQIDLPASGSNIKNLVKEIMNTDKIFKNASENNITYIFIFSVTSKTLWSIKFYLLFSKKVKCVIIPHGLLEEILHRPNLRHPTEWVFWFNFPFSFLNGKRIKYIALGEPVREGLIKKSHR